MIDSFERSASREQFLEKETDGKIKLIAVAVVLVALLVIVAIFQ